MQSKWFDVYKLKTHLLLTPESTAPCRLIHHVTHVIVAICGGDGPVARLPLICYSDRLGSFLLDGLGVIQKCQLVEFLDICNTRRKDTVTTVKGITQQELPERLLQVWPTVSFHRTQWSGYISVTGQKFCSDIWKLMFKRHSFDLWTWLCEKWLNKLNKLNRNEMRGREAP